MSKIAQGFYPAMPASTYYKSHAIGSSLMKLLLEDNEPADFWWACPWLNPDAGVLEEKSEALLFGNAMHMMILEPERFAASFTIKPGVNTSTVPGCLGQGQHEQMLRMRDVLLSKPTLARLILGGKSEVSMFWEHEETGAPCRGRLDFLKDYTVVDLKFLQEVNKRAVAEAIAKYNYDMQAASYLDGLRRVTGRDDGNFVFLFQEKHPPYKIMARVLEGDVLAEGKSKYEAAMRRYQNSLSLYGTARWPDYEDEVGAIDATQMPRWWSGNRNL